MKLNQNYASKQETWDKKWRSIKNNCFCHLKFFNSRLSFGSISWPSFNFPPSHQMALWHTLQNLISVFNLYNHYKPNLEADLWKWRTKCRSSGKKIPKRLVQARAKWAFQKQGISEFKVNHMKQEPNTGFSNSKRVKRNAYNNTKFNHGPHGPLELWTAGWQGKFGNLKLWEISENANNIISTSLKVV